MKINKVTITGADDSTSIDDLVRLQNKYPFVEWGILLSLNYGRPRFPSGDFMYHLFKESSLLLSGHICGELAKEFMKGIDFGGKDEDSNIWAKAFKRFQINFNFKTSGEFDLEKVIKEIKDTPNIDFIFQYNKSNESTLKPALIKNLFPSNVNMLFDSSGGRGTMIKEIQTPFLSNYTGYAGGLNVLNVSEFCEQLVKFPNNSEVWIDVETGVRTNNQLDMVLVESFLKQVSKFIS